MRFVHEKPNLKTAFIQILLNFESMLKTASCFNSVKLPGQNYKLLVQNFNLMKVKRNSPIIFYHYILINLFIKVHGKACWVAGWGKAESNGVSSDALKSIGVNLFHHSYCRNHRLAFDKLYQFSKIHSHFQFKLLFRRR